MFFCLFVCLFFSPKLILLIGQIDHFGQILQYFKCLNLEMLNMDLRNFALTSNVVSWLFNMKQLETYPKLCRLDLVIYKVKVRISSNCLVCEQTGYTGTLTVINLY